MSAAPYKTVVGTAAGSIDLTTLATVKAELGITTGGSDADLTRMVTQASTTAATHCNRIFAKEAVTDHFRLQNEPRRVDMLTLSRFPVDTAAAITVVEDGVTLTASGYELDPATGFLWRLSGDERAAWARTKVTVAYSAGYALLAELPQDIERAVIVMVKQAWFAKSRDPMVKQEDVPGVLSQSYWVGSVPGQNGAIPAEAEALLAPYRVIPI